MKRTIIILMISLLLAGCSKNNPVAPTTNTIQSENLKVTFSISKPSFGIHDTLKAITTVFNPGDTTVNFSIPVCWPISWYSVKDMAGTTGLSYKAPQNYGCNSLIEYSIMPHQSKLISPLTVMFPIANLDSAQSAQGAYLLTVDNGFGIFSLKFTVN